MNGIDQEKEIVEISFEVADLKVIDSTFPLELYRVTEIWDEHDITWTNKPECDSYLGKLGGEDKEDSLDISKVIKENDTCLSVCLRAPNALSRSISIEFEEDENKEIYLKIKYSVEDPLQVYYNIAIIAAIIGAISIPVLIITLKVVKRGKDKKKCLNCGKKTILPTTIKCPYCRVKVEDKENKKDNSQI